LALLCAEYTDRCEMIQAEKLVVMKELEALKEKATKLEQDLQTQVILNKRQNEALQLFSKQSKGDSNTEKILELEKQISEKETELQKTANSFKVLSQKYVDTVKQLDAKNKQNTEIMKTSGLQEKKILIMEEEKNKLKSSLEKQSTLEKELEKLKERNKVIEGILPNQFKKQSDDSLLVIENAIAKLVEHSSIMDKREKETLDRMKAIELTLEHSREEANKKIQELQSTITAMEMEMESKDVKPNVSFSNFKPGEFAMFIPDKNGHYEACNKNSPNYYLSPFVLENFENESKQKAPIFGQIVEIQSNKASSASNPFSLSQGTPYYEVIITSNYF